MLRHSLATLKGEQEFIDFHRALLSLFCCRELFSFCHFNRVRAHLQAGGLARGTAMSAGKWVKCRKRQYIVGCRGVSQLGGPCQGNPPRVYSNLNYINSYSILSVLSRSTTLCGGVINSIHTPPIGPPLFVLRNLRTTLYSEVIPSNNHMIQMKMILFSKVLTCLYF